MRIILTIDHSPWSPYCGGAQQATHSLATALSERNHEVTVIYTKAFPEKISIPDNLPYDIVWSNYISTKSKRKAFLRPLSAISVKNKVEKLLRANKNVIVHCNGEEGGLIHLLKGKFKFCFISTPHHPHYPQVFFQNENLSFTQYIKLILTDGKYLMQRSALQHADYCTPPSEWTAKLIQKAFKLDSTRIIPVPNGVSSQFLNYHRDTHAKNGPIVFFGRLSYTKGVDTLIKAFHLVDKDLPQCIIVGRGELEENLKTDISKYGLTDKISFKPWLSHHELAELLTRARMTVLPSRLENFSLAILESMCVGSPTISTKVGGTPEIIKHMENGYLVNPDNPKELADAIQYLLNNPDKAETMGKKASEFIRKELTWDRTAERFEKIYTNALKKT